MSSEDKLVRKPRRRELGGVLLLAGTIFTCLALCGAYWWAIQPERQPGCPYLRGNLRDKCEFDREFSIDVLLVDETFFPAEVEIERIEPIGMHGAIERAGISIRQGDYYIAGYEVQRWVSTEIARQKYLDALGVSFPPRLAPWLVPEDIDYQSPVAEQFRVACTIESIPLEVCRGVGQYQEYVSIFNSQISPEFVTHEDFRAVLARIDERIAEYLGLED